jgi:hypothetical protein
VYSLVRDHPRVQHLIDARRTVAVHEPSDQ